MEAEGAMVAGRCNMTGSWEEEDDDDEGKDEEIDAWERREGSVGLAGSKQVKIGFRTEVVLLEDLRVR